MDDDPVVRRIEGALGAPGLVAALAALPAADVTSLLLAVARQRAGSVSPTSLLRAHARSQLVRPAQLDPRALGACERQLDDLLPVGYERIDLAPVTPFGGGRSGPPRISCTWRPCNGRSAPSRSRRPASSTLSSPPAAAPGGFTDWCARLLGDRKERVLTSGIGLDRLAS